MGLLYPLFCSITEYLESHFIAEHPIQVAGLERMDQQRTLFWNYLHSTPSEAFNLANFQQYWHWMHKEIKSLSRVVDDTIITIPLPTALSNLMGKLNDILYTGNSCSLISYLSGLLSLIRILKYKCRAPRFPPRRASRACHQSALEEYRTSHLAT